MRRTTKSRLSNLDKKIRIEYINQYGDDEVYGWFKGPEPEYKVMRVAINHNATTFQMKYPFGQRHHEDTLLKRFRKSIWECSLCNKYYGKIYKNRLKGIPRNFYPKFEYIPEGSYMYIHCYCEDVHCLRCAKRIGRAPGNVTLSYCKWESPYPYPFHYSARFAGWRADSQGGMGSMWVLGPGCRPCNSSDEGQDRRERLITLSSTGKEYEDEFDDNGMSVDNTELMDRWYKSYYNSGSGGMSFSVPLQGEDTL